MMPNLAHVVIGATAASSAAILFIAMMRKPLQLAVGAQAAYWMWLLAPVSVFATLLPAPSKSLPFVTSTLPSLSAILNSAVAPSIGAATPGGYLAVGLIAWLTGAGVTLALLIKRQLNFIQSLGEMSADVGGVQRSEEIVAPMLLGALRPRVILPIDFEARYTAAERALMLAHERAHLARGDILVNAFAAGWLCLWWFNPLVYWAMASLREDQELACDAKVLHRSGTSPRCYAHALLKTQLAMQSARRIPVGCHWHSSHPLQKRISMLKRPLPGLQRKLVGMTGALALAFAGGYAVWASSRPLQEGSPILIHLKFTVTDSTDTVSQETQYLAESGESVPIRVNPPYDARCVAFLPRQQDGSLAWDEHKRGPGPAPTEGQILLNCMIRKDGKVVATPALITADAKVARVEFENAEPISHATLEVTATTSKEKISAARRAAR
ncbi:MAG TPA: M56 family metallopeptidase [Steroidobacteraceae bacterium]|jgi:beta-lactamase regulating signal transducer with metallopeptidase domain